MTTPPYSEREGTRVKLARVRTKRAPWIEVQEGQTYSSEANEFVEALLLEPGQVGVVLSREDLDRLNDWKREADEGRGLNDDDRNLAAKLRTALDSTTREGE
jgi:hypothetical protein